MRPPEAKMEVLADPAALARRVADWILDIALAKSGPFAIALSGGSTPRPVYEQLAAPPRLSRFPWPRVHWFFGDERFVASSDPQSNYRMVQEVMLKHAPIPAGNIHKVPTEGIEPDEAAGAYALDLKAFYGAERFDPLRPLFDLVLLGLGTDGHTASLFPGTSALNEVAEWVAAVRTAPPTRITLTFPALESSKEIVFLVAGKEKHAILERLRRGDGDFPAASLCTNGVIRIFADRAAAG